MNDNNNNLDFSLVLASSVHDMKNSLGMLLNSLEVMMREHPPEDSGQVRRFATLQYETSRINSELIQLLSIYRMDNNRLPINIDEHFVLETLEDQLARNELLFESRHLRVKVDCDTDLHWYYDSELIGGVIHNVLVNCARYADQQLQVSAVVEGEQLCVTVADDGEGYPDVMISAPQNYDAGVSFSSGSTNLGLFFASAVTRKHCRGDTCGRIELSNGGSLGGGVFKLFLP